MTDADVVALTTRLLGAAFALGAVFGAVAQRTAFCTMGAVADVFATGDTRRLRQWALAAGTAILGFGALAGAGWVRAADSIYTGRTLPWASHVAGGLMFGFGMVLASGCGNRALVRLGGGNLKSLVVLIVMGASALAALKGAGATLRTTVLDPLRLDLPAAQDLPALLVAAWPAAAAPGAAVPGIALAAVIGGAGVAWALWRRDERSVESTLGGLAIGLLVCAMWGLSGRVGHLAEDPRTLQEAFLATGSGRMESFSFVAPVAGLLDGLLYFSESGRRLTMGMVAALGVVAGSAAVALVRGSFRWEGFAGVEDSANHLIGAALMGLGGVTALGCTIGQGISGVSTLSLGSVIALAAILAGAVAALRWQVWRLERSDR